jgi:hypothetical protein
MTTSYRNGIEGSYDKRGVWRETKHAKLGIAQAVTTHGDIFYRAAWLDIDQLRAYRCSIYSRSSMDTVRDYMLMHMCTAYGPHARHWQVDVHS